ncbi:SurA N-terminal domain-containing protein [Candidatus Saccharibacteria bacterium]|nr:SurA N-terminal domain-containing protein [Candidatus Saccharibacteria bacterium]
MKLKISLGKKTGRKTEKEKVEERREEVLSRGRKFKYPLQYAKHKLVINTVVIAMVAVIALTTAGWAALYKLGDMGDIMYRISTILPISVAKIDGENVRFSDYLRTARSSLTTLEQQSGLESNSEDMHAMQNQYKRAALTQAEDLTYALKLGRELGLEVTDEEVAQVFNEHRKVGGAERSEESFLKVLATNFGLSKSEYQRMLYLSLMRAKVEQQIDENANKLAARAALLIDEHDAQFDAVKDAMGDDVEMTTTDGLIDSKNVDGGRAAMAMKLNVGQVSEKFLSTNGDGYYFVKTLEKTDTQVSYASLYIKFTEFDQRLAQIRAQNGVKEYIVFDQIEE